MQNSCHHTKSVRGIPGHESCGVDWLCRYHANGDRAVVAAVEGDPHPALIRLDHEDRRAGEQHEVAHAQQRCQHEARGPDHAVIDERRRGPAPQRRAGLLLHLLEQARPAALRGAHVGKQHRRGRLPLCLPVRDAAASVRRGRPEFLVLSRDGDQRALDASRESMELDDDREVPARETRGEELLLDELPDPEVDGYGRQ